MANETPKFPSFSNLLRKLSKHEFSKQQKSLLNPIERFVQKFSRFFAKEMVQESESRLSGRIHQLRKHVDLLILQFFAIKEELEKEADPELSLMTINVVDPLIKEIQRLLKNHVDCRSVAQQVKDSQAYSDWIEKAKSWIELYSMRHHQKEDIHKAVIDHTVQEFHARIDRDFQLIQDYLNHIVDGSEIDEDQKTDLKEQLEPKLLQYLMELQMLKNIPQDLTLASLNIWRADSDQARENYFGAALHIIDQVSNPMQISSKTQDLSDLSSMEIRKGLTELEEKINKLEASIRSLKSIEDRESKKICKAQLISLEEDAHQLNSNLRLTHEHVDRVQHALRVLDALRKKL